MVHSDHRLLVYDVRAKGLQCTLVVAHAPIEPKTVADRESNTKCDSLTSTLTGRRNVILLIDADAHVGGEVSEHVGCGRQQMRSTALFWMMSILGRPMWITTQSCWCLNP